MIKHTTLEIMRIYGGSFVQGLVDLYSRADEINQKKLEDTFKNYFDQYEKISKEISKD